MPVRCVQLTPSICLDDFVTRRMSQLLEKRMNRFKKLSIALVTTAAMGGAGAQNMSSNSGYYGEVGYLGIKYKEDGGASASPKMIRGIVGKEIDANWAVEAMIAFTASKGTLSRGSNLELSGSGYGIFVKPKMEVAKDTEVFGRLGYAHSKWDLSSPNATSSESRNRVAYGIGLQTKFTKEVFGQIDYMKYSRDSGWTADGITLSVGTGF